MNMQYAQMVLAHEQAHRDRSAAKYMTTGRQSGFARSSETASTAPTRVCVIGTQLREGG